MGIYTISVCSIGQLVLNRKEVKEMCIVMIKRSTGIVCNKYTGISDFRIENGFAKFRAGVFEYLMIDLDVYNMEIRNDNYDDLYEYDYDDDYDEVLVATKE